jgi:tRNA(adenine34) deaminase
MRALALATLVTHALHTPHRLPPLGPARDAAAMAIALDEARAAAALGEVPVGALIVDDDTGEVLSTGRNAVEETHDATAHAELRAMRAAAASVENWRLANCTLYCTLEPCVVCLGAAYAFRVPRVVYGAPDHRLGAAGSWLDLPSETHPFHTIGIRGGVQEDASAALLKDFFRARRLEGRRRPPAADGPQAAKPGCEAQPP